MPGEREEKMSITKLVLADSTEIILQGGAALGYMKAHYQNKDAMLADWNKLTADNLKQVQILTDGAVVGNYEEMILENETSTVLEDGTVDTVWNIREKTETEKLKDRIAVLEANQEAIVEGQEIQDGAISDLGMAVSEIVTGGEA